MAQDRTFMLDRSSTSSLAAWLPYAPPMLIGLLLRAAWVLADTRAIVHDELPYDRLARQLAAGAGFGFDIWPPGWPMILGLAYRAFGTAEASGYWLNVALSMLTIGLVAALTYLQFGRRAAIFSAWITALLPSYILLNGLLMYEVWVQFLLLLALVLALRAPWHWSVALAFGAITALLVLTRPFWLLLPALLWLSAWAWRGQRPPLAHALLATGLAAALVAPWVIYESGLAGHFVPIALNGGLNLWIGNNPQANGGNMAPLPEMWDPRNDGYARDLALRWMREHPQRVLELLPIKLWNMFRIEAYSIPQVFMFVRPRIALVPQQMDRLGLLMNIGYWAISGCAVASLALMLLLRRRAALALLIPFGFNIATYLVFHGEGRYRWPLQFVLIVYAAALPTLLRRPGTTRSAHL